MDFFVWVEKTMNTLWYVFHKTFWMLFQVKLVVLDIVHDRGAENLAIEDLVQEVAPRATDLVSNSARSDLSKEVKKFLKERAEEDY